MNKYKCTITGKSYSQAQIDNHLTKAYRDIHESGEYTICRGDWAVATDNSHTISQKRCKHIHKTSLIWDRRNIVSLCRKCHRVWENGGEEAKKLFCYQECMNWLEQHDLETFNKYLYLK